ncbi:GNAT family N-acetyltransferase [Streptomyces sp. NPDC057362]|uniref:GNAT family N-acetyltransferase n=1 Tax=Streptomyces sp. NPDC057362 TaxID=3346106 RepID=UPI003631EED3
MTDQARTRRAAVALAARGEGQAAAALGALALQDIPLPADSPLSPLAAAIDHHGGCVPLPYGQGQCWVARTGEAVSGMLYATPPIRWLQQQPSPHRNSLIHSLVEIELLAVAESHRTQGVGTVLLQEAENTARANGTHLALAKIRVGASPSCAGTADADTPSQHRTSPSSSPPATGSPPATTDPMATNSLRKHCSPAQPCAAQPEPAPPDPPGRRHLNPGAASTRPALFPGTAEFEPGHAEGSVNQDQGGRGRGDHTHVGSRRVPATADPRPGERRSPRGRPAARPRPRRADSARAAVVHESDSASDAEACRRHATQKKPRAVREQHMIVTDADTARSESPSLTRPGALSSTSVGGFCITPLLYVAGWPFPSARRRPRAGMVVSKRTAHPAQRPALHERRYGSLQLTEE